MQHRKPCSNKDAREAAANQAFSLKGPGSNQTDIFGGGGQNDYDRNFLLYLTTVHVFENFWGGSIARLPSSGCGPDYNHVLVGVTVLYVAMTKLSMNFPSKKRFLEA